MKRREEHDSWFYELVASVAMSLQRDLYQGRVQGQAHIPREGAFILAANHASHFDPPMLGAILPRQVYFLARQSLMASPFSKRILESLNSIPVKREATRDLNAFRRAFQVLKSGEGLLIFPEGKRTPDGKPLQAQKGLGMIACRSRAPVLPVHVSGTFEALPKGSRWPNLNTDICIRIGKLIPPESYDPGPEHSDRYQCAAQYCLDRVFDFEN